MAGTGRHAIGRRVQIRLGSDQQLAPGSQLRFIGLECAVPFDAEQDEVRRRQITPAHFDAEPVDDLLALPESCGIHQPHRPTEDIGVRLDGIASGARCLRHQRPAGAEQGVEEGGLPGIGPAGEHHQRAFAEPLAGGRGRDEPLDSPAHVRRALRDALDRHRAVVLLGKIDLVAEHRLEVEQGLAQLAEAP